MTREPDEIDFKALVRGIPNHVVTRLLSEATPGIDFVGSSKRSMAAAWADTRPFSAYCSMDRRKFAKLIAEWRKEQADTLERERAAALPVKPGDEVVVFDGDQPCDLVKVTHVTANRIYTTAYPDAAYTLSGKLIRRRFASDAHERIQLATEENRRALRRCTLINKLVHAPWHLLSEQQMQKILDMVAENKS